MFLEEIANPQTIVEDSEDYGQKLYFDYQKVRRGQHVMSHPNPVVLYLGTWRMTDRFGEKKKFLCALNLAILADEEELAAVQRALPDILKSKNMKSRYRIGKTLLPDIFRRAYRTYNLKKISTRPIKGRLYALKATPEDKEEAEKTALGEYPHKDWDELDSDTRSGLIDKAIQARGEEDIERQERAKKDRKELEEPEPEPEPELEPEPEPELEPEPEPELAKPPKPPKPPKPSKPPKRPKPAKPPAIPKPKTMMPLEPGPGIEPEPEPEPKMDHPPIQSPIKSIETGMPTPKKIQIGQTQPTKKKQKIRKLPPADWEERAKQVAQRGRPIQKLPPEDWEERAKQVAQRRAAQDETGPEEQLLP